MSDMTLWKTGALGRPVDHDPFERPALSIVVPCFNEEACLVALHQRLTAAATSATSGTYEIVLVDDGSRDKTWEMMKRLSQEDPNVVSIRLSRNHGHQLALSAGLDLCRGDLILIIDADLQDPPELLGAMIERLRAEEADVVYAVREQRLGESLSKRLFASLFYRVLARMSDGTAIPLDTGDFRLMTRRALDVLRAMPERSRFIRGMVAWIGFKQVAFTYQRAERAGGETGYPFAKMMRLALDAFTGFSSAPLRLASYAGFFFALLSVALIGYSLLGWASGHAIPGWTSMMVVILVIGSVQMFVLGVMGEYIGRLYDQSKDRPLYIVDEMAGGSIVFPSLGVVAAHGKIGHRVT